MQSRRFHWLVPTVLLATGSTAASATPDSDVTIYRCTDDRGHVSLRDTPCRPGRQQDVRTMQRPIDPPPDPAPANPPPAAAPDPTPATPTRPPPPVVARTPPQPIYQCITFEGERYTSDNAEGNPRWVPLWVLGYSPRPPRNPLGDRVGAPAPEPPGNAPGPPDLPPAIGLALTPGRWIRDRCYLMSQADACAHLRDRADDLRRRYFSVRGTARDALRPQRDALAARLHNDCGAR